jgi:hypothetical protein
MQKLTLVLALFAMLSLATATTHKFKKLTPAEPLIPDTEVYKRLIVNPETLCGMTDILWCAEEIAGKSHIIPFFTKRLFSTALNCN